MSKHIARSGVIAIWLLLTPIISHASFIEATIGTAVVNDATAAVYNPAGLLAVKSAQIIGLESLANFNNQFNGEVRQTATGFTQTGTSSSHTRYDIPALYAALPLTSQVTVGLAVVGNDFSRSIDDTSILRYAQSSNTVKNLDIVPAIGARIHSTVSIGAALNFTYANFDSDPMTGYPSLNVPDSTSHNQANGNGFGADAGILWRPSEATVIGLNYRSAITYHLSGKSTYHGSPSLTSNHYNTTTWTPARTVISVNHFITPKLGFIGTAQYLQWNIYTYAHINGYATRVGTTPTIINATVPYHMQNSWVLTVGAHYRLTPAWIARVATTYIESPGNPSYQIINGDNYVVGASTGYNINDTYTIDASYAHAFMKTASIHINNSRNQINGTNSGARDAVSIKVTINI